MSPIPKLKVGDDELDIDELENAEYNENDDFEPYTGPIPPKNTRLGGYIKNAWWTFDKSDNRMIIYLFIAEGNTGDLAKYNGLSIFERQSMTTKVKFKWAPTIRLLGFTLKDLKNKLYVRPEEEDHATLGAIIEKVGSFKPGEDEGGAWVDVLTDVDTYQGEKAARVGRFLEWTDQSEDADEEDADEEPDEEDVDLEEEAEEDTAAEAETDEAEEEDEEDDQEYEDEEEPEAPAKPAARSSARTSSRPAARSAPAKGATRGTRPAATSGARRGAKAGSKQDPPF